MAPGQQAGRSPEPEVSTSIAKGQVRTHDGVPAVVDDLTVAKLLWQPDAKANHIAWLVWHLARQQNEQVAQLASQKSSWTDDVWVAQFDLA